MKQKLKNTQRGITLVALVITIIVLLILAMVSIKIAISGGLTQKAKDATDTHTIGAEKEKITLGYNEYTLAKVSKKSVKAPTVEGTASVTGDETAGWTITFTKTNNEYKLTKDGEVILVKQNGIYVIWLDNGDDTFTKEDVTVKLGDYVNYDELSNGTKTHTPDTSKGAGTSITGRNNVTGRTYFRNERTINRKFKLESARSK